MMKIKNRFNATRFDFQLHVHTLQPWPSGNKAIAIGWQRGKRRRGATNSIMPVPSSERGGSTVVRFNERINFKSTLYKVRMRGAAAAGRAGLSQHAESPPRGAACLPDFAVFLCLCQLI